ncbi:MAG: cupin domain-containing protein [Solirubrobacterales bacterium]
MEIHRYETVPHELRGAEVRDQYDSEHFRIVVTHIPAGHVQNEHRHTHLYDITWVVDGEVEVSERDGDVVASAVLRPGDLVVCSPGRFHNIANRSLGPATLLTLKFVRPTRLTPKQFADLCQGDWYAPDPTRA